MEAAEAEVVEAVEVEAEEQPTPQQLSLLSPGIGDQSTLTFPQDLGTGARCIIGSEKVLISVWNQAPALGKTPGYQNQTNETLTSSTIKTTLKSFMICCIVTSYQKYIH